MRRLALRAWRPSLGLSLVSMGAGAASTALGWDGVADGAAMVAWALLGLGAVGGLLADDLDTSAATAERRA